MRRLVLLSLVAFGWLAADARACSCVGPAAEFPRAAGAFSGTIVERSGTGRELAYTFEVEKVYKGSFPRRVTYSSNDQEASCGMDRPVGFRTGIVIYGEEAQVGICNLISEAELDDLATPGPPGAMPPGAALASLLGTLLGTCWALFA